MKLIVYKMFLNKLNWIIEAIVKSSVIRIGNSELNKYEYNHIKPQSVEINLRNNAIRMSHKKKQ